MKRAVTLRFDEDLYEEINKWQEKLGISFSAVVRLAVKAGLKTDLSALEDPFENPPVDERLKAAIIALAKATANEDVVESVLGESLDSFQREEIRKEAKKPVKEKKKTSAAAKAASPASVPIEPKPVIKTEEVPQAPTPIAKPAASPLVESPKPTEEIPKEDDVIEVAETTDVVFPDDLMSQLDSLLDI